MLEVTMQFKKNTALPRITCSPDEICSIFGLNSGSLANLRSKRQGPRYYKIGRKVLYKPAEVERWITENPVLTTDCLPGCHRGGAR